MRFLVANRWPLARWPGPGCWLAGEGRAGRGACPAEGEVSVEMTAGQWAPLLGVGVSLSEDGRHSWHVLLGAEGKPQDRRSWRVPEGATPLAEGREGRQVEEGLGQWEGCMPPEAKVAGRARVPT